MGKKMEIGKEYSYFDGELQFEGEYLNDERNDKGKEYYFNGKGKWWNGKGYNINGNIEYEIKDGKGYIKEYEDDGKLLFEAEFLYDNKNGKGKEYNYLNDKLEFEGEYLNGKKWNGNGYNINGNIEYKIKDGKGYIKEYNLNGELEFEGEYLNGERNGKGKEYYKNGELEFEGEYLNGERNRKGKEYDDNGNLKFEGENLDGKKNQKII